jgi:hypothetical protein
VRASFLPGLSHSIGRSIAENNGNLSILLFVIVVVIMLISVLIVVMVLWAPMTVACRGSSISPLFLTSNLILISFSLNS